MQIFRWFNEEAARASRRKRSSAAASELSSGKKFQSDVSAKSDIFRLINDTHPGATRFLDDAVVRDGLADQFERGSEPREAILGGGVP